VEFAQFFARLGTRVQLIQRGDHLLRDFDADAAGEIEKAFRREGIEVHTGTRIVGASRSAEGREVAFEFKASPGVRHVCRGEEVFHGLGRSAATQGLNLEGIGVRLEKGRILTDASQRSSVPNIFAAGDCTGPHDIVHLAILQGEVAAQTILKPSTTKRMDYRVLLSVVFTDPQVAQVGLTEREAKRQGIDFVAASYPFTDHGKSMILDAKEGFVKLLARRETGEIVGGTCVGPQAGELIHEVAVAMAARMNVRQFAQVPHYHPTLAEIWTYPAEELADALLPGVE
jgi:pyruvate/2-oxoglutarate dehydrogenase complex dihydrolipoamide dehydrogenase (E3) component